MSESTWSVIVVALIGAVATIISAIISKDEGHKGKKNHKIPPKPSAPARKVNRKKAVSFGLITLIVAGIIIVYFRPFAPAPIPLFLNGVEYTDPQHLCAINVENVFAPGKKNTVRIKVDNTNLQGYCSWVLPLQKYDASGKTSLTFWVKGEKGGEQFQVGICDSSTYNGQEPKVEETATTGWKKVTIPLDKFRGQNLTALENLSIGFQTKGNIVVFISDVYFEP